MNRLGQTIRLLRLQRGWNQGEMAQRLKISVPAYSKIETGVSDINLSRLTQIATIFELSLVGLLTYQQSQEGIEPLKVLQARLQLREQEVLSLQKKVIQLFEGLRLLSPDT